MTAPVTSNPNPSRPGGPANAPVHRVGETIDTVDQVSSVYLMGLAIAGAIVVDLVLALII